MKCRTIGILVTFALGLLVALPVTAAPPAGKVPRIGFLGLSSSSLMSTRLTAFREGLRELGYVEGQSIAIEYRWAEGKVERLPELAADLIQLRMDLIVASSHTVVVPLKQATSTLPIVMMGSHEPVARGLIDSFARPGGNVTGLAFQDTELSTKRLELLMEMVPKISRMAVLWEPDEGGITQLRATEGAAQAYWDYSCTSSRYGSRTTSTRPLQPRKTDAHKP